MGLNDIVEKGSGGIAGLVSEGAGGVLPETLEAIAVQRAVSQIEENAKALGQQLPPANPQASVLDQNRELLLHKTRQEVARMAQQGGQQLAIDRQRALQTAMQGGQIAAMGGIPSLMPARGGAVPPQQFREGGGVKRNNPWNVRATGDEWLGMDGVDGGFVSFESIPYGARAADRTLRTYGREHGIDTLRDAITRWAPPSENDTEAYVDFVANRIGLDPNAPINLDDAGTRRALLSAMGPMEGGVDYTTDELEEMLARLEGGAQQVPANRRSASAAPAGRFRDPVGMRDQRRPTNGQANGQANRRSARQRVAEDLGVTPAELDARLAQTRIAATPPPATPSDPSTVQQNRQSAVQKLAEHRNVPPEAVREAVALGTSLPPRSTPVTPPVPMTEPAVPPMTPMDTHMEGVRKFFRGNSTPVNATGRRSAPPANKAQSPDWDAVLEVLANGQGSSNVESLRNMGRAGATRTQRLREEGRQDARFEAGLAAEVDALAARQIAAMQKSAEDRQETVEDRIVEANKLFLEYWDDTLRPRAEAQLKAHGGDEGEATWGTNLEVLRREAQARFVDQMLAGTERGNSAPSALPDDIAAILAQYGQQ